MTRSPKRGQRDKKRNSHTPVIALIIFLVGLLVYLLGWSPLLSIKTIEISAGGFESVVTPLVVPNKAHIGLPLARVSVSRISRDLLREDWVRSINIDRRWLARDLKIVIEPRIPIAQFSETDGATKFFDHTGISFALPIKRASNAQLPVVTFDSSTQNSRGSAAFFLAHAPSNLIAGMSALHIDRSGRVTLRTKIHGFPALFIKWGDEADTALKARVIDKLLGMAENKKILTIDLSNPLAPIVSPVK
jgi:cell division septal protein FtsQ